MTPVRFPAMRDEVVGALEALSDRKYQQRVWIEHQLPKPNYYDELKLEVHILFDDTEVCRHPEEWVGAVLYPGEVPPLRELGDVFGAMLDDLGDVSDADYLADPRWDEVIRLAQVALAAMRGGEPGSPAALPG